MKSKGMQTVAAAATIILAVLIALSYLVNADRFRPQLEASPRTLPQRGENARGHWNL